MASIHINESTIQAKRVVALLNGTMLGGKKRFYREDIWTLKYLSKFKV